MELVTHAVLGAAVGLAMRRATPLPTRDGVVLACAGAAFPDLDFVGFLVSPLRFLADWHQGATHSLLLLPLWGLIAASLYAGWRRTWQGFGAALLLFCAGAASHVGLDATTAYGTMLLYPATSRRFSLDLLYVVDPFFTLSVLLAAAVLQRWRPAAALPVACAVVGGYLALAAQNKVLAREIARNSGPPAFTRFDVYPQPYSPFNWKLIATDGVDHVVSDVNLLGHPPLVPAFAGALRASAQAFRPPGTLAWTPRSRRLAPSDAAAATADRLWDDPRFEPFRRFATHPAIDTDTDTHGEAGCIWFTDLRYDLPQLPATFRYGFCRNQAEGAWQLHRLRYFSTALERAL